MALTENINTANKKIVEGIDDENRKNFTDKYLKIVLDNFSHK